MKEYGINEVKRVLRLLCQVCLEEKDRLTEIDSHLGDGDMGLSMEKGALAIQAELESREYKDATELLFQCASAFNRAAPSTLGTLLSFGMMRIGKELGHAASVSEDQIPFLVQAFADAIMTRGKAQEEQKTILDSLLPFSRVLSEKKNAGCSLEESLREGAEAAWKGMERTKGMEAKTGRASWLGGRNQEWPDGGAFLCAAAVRRLSESINMPEE